MKHQNDFVWRKPPKIVAEIVKARVGVDVGGVVKSGPGLRQD